jgi:hypothetical protein
MHSSGPQSLLHPHEVEKKRKTPLLIIMVVLDTPVAKQQTFEPDCENGAWGHAEQHIYLIELFRQFTHEWDGAIPKMSRETIELEGKLWNAGDFLSHSTMS